MTGFPRRLSAPGIAPIAESLPALAHLRLYFYFRPNCFTPLVYARLPPINWRLPQSASCACELPDDSRCAAMTLGQKFHSPRCRQCPTAGIREEGHMRSGECRRYRAELLMLATQFVHRPTSTIATPLPAIVKMGPTYRISPKSF
jgi:hypothetical protein